MSTSKLDKVGRAIFELKATLCRYVLLGENESSRNVDEAVNNRLKERFRSLEKAWNSITCK